MFDQFCPPGSEAKLKYSECEQQSEKSCFKSLL